MEGAHWLGPAEPRKGDFSMKRIVPAMAAATMAMIVALSLWHDVQQSCEIVVWCAR